jgi:hypothetical protein
VTTANPAAHPGKSQEAVVEAALLLLDRMGLTPADLAAAGAPQREVPTFAQYVPVVSAAVTAGTRRAYGSYWNRIVEHWGGRRLDEPTPSEIRQLMAYVKTHVVARRNARGGRSAAEHLVAALRCLYRHAQDDGLITEADNPARKGLQHQRITPGTPGTSTRRRRAGTCSSAAGCRRLSIRAARVRASSVFGTAAASRGGLRVFARWSRRRRCDARPERTGPHLRTRWHRPGPRGWQCSSL